MDLLRKLKFAPTLNILFFLLFGVLLSGCQIGYFLKSAKGQLSILTSRIPLDEALKDPKINEKEKEKMRLALKAKKFAADTVGLNASENYSDFVQLDRPYVSYVVNASQKWELKGYEWDFPIVGKMPYKGFFNPEDANEEEKELKKQDLDTYVRGVSAFSTLGWFRDPILSSMTKYKDHDFVNTIIHESVHATIYIKNSADFNERLAVFVGNQATEDFYLSNEGENSPTLKLIRDEDHDEKIFSKFITEEINLLKDWFEKNKSREESVKDDRIREIQTRFKDKVLKQMITQTYDRFTEMKLNNARLLLYKTYVADLADFEKLYKKSGNNYRQFMSMIKTLETEKNPELKLKDLLLN